MAIELVHNFSLLHDDIIDGDRERRHRPTVWAEFGVGPAIIAGDALADAGHPGAARGADARAGRGPPRALAEATQAMIAGQADDMAFETAARRSPWRSACDMEAGKTGALLVLRRRRSAPSWPGPPTPRSTRCADFGAPRRASPSRPSTTCSASGASRASTGKPVGSDLVASTRRPCRSSTALAGPAAGVPSSLRCSAAELAGDDVGEAPRLIEESGARDEAIAIAEAHLDAALRRSTGADLLPGPRAELVAIARFVTERDR